jgi:LAO/AO transport system kinase
LILQPETGDEVQWMKSGVRDWADFFVVNKSDLPGAELMAESLKEHGAPEDRILLTSSKRAKGLSELLTALADLRTKISWKTRSKILHREHARALFFEAASQKLDREFKKKSDRLTQSPYKALDL